MEVSKRKLAKMIDHTQVKLYATKKDVTRLCGEARKYGFGCICVNPYYVPLAVDLLKDTDVKVCTGIGFLLELP